MTIEMYDATHNDLAAGGFPANPAAVAGYSNGASWCQWTTADWDRFLHSWRVSITVENVHNGARVCDCETGDLTTDEAAEWAWGEITQYHRRPTIYCNTSTKPAVEASLAKYGLQLGNQVDWWEANYSSGPGISPGAVAKQYGGVPGKYDVSTVDEAWLQQVAAGAPVGQPATPPPAAPPPPPPAQPAPTASGWASIKNWLKAPWRIAALKKAGMPTP